MRFSKENQTHKISYNFPENEQIAQAIDSFAPL